MQGLRTTDMHPRHMPEVLFIEREVFSTPWSGESFAFELSTAGTRARVAILGGMVAGYSCFRIGGGEGHILNLAVRPDLTKRGIAKALVSEMLAVMKGSGVRTAFLEVRASNKEAIALYMGFGFGIAGTRKGYYESPREDATVMTLELS